VVLRHTKGGLLATLALLADLVASVLGAKRVGASYAGRCVARYLS